MPQSPETGYSYIKAEREFDKSDIKGLNIESFIEKPNKTKANELIKDKRYTWNSGMFLFKSKTI